MGEAVMSVRSGRKRSVWPPERVDRLRREFEAGLSLEMIARQMATTKGSVGNKVDRLGWKRPATLVVVPLEDRKPKPPPVIETRSVRLEHLEAGECHWPLDPDHEGVMLFCGAPASGTYCEDHNRKAHRRPNASERKLWEGLAGKMDPRRSDDDPCL
ncbi:MAG: GcrA family cell cycle regulator [Caulobacter sp.]